MCLPLSLFSAVPSSRFSCSVVSRLYFVSSIFFLRLLEGEENEQEGTFLASLYVFSDSMYFVLTRRLLYPAAAVLRAGCEKTHLTQHILVVPWVWRLGTCSHDVEERDTMHYC